MRNAVLALCLVVVAVLPYRETGGFEFVYDDSGYVADNAAVRAGLTAEGLRWAWSSFAMANWHPLTWLSHMADVSIFGIHAGRHHLVNVGFHALNTLLLFLALLSLTGALWRPFVAAAIFAAHPLHVESVAWISERKDLLSAVFFLLSLLAYRRYAARRGAGSYALLLLLFALGLLAKPMIVTLPAVLLLLDFWPLGRTRGAFFPLLLEKVPLALLAAASSAVTMVAQGRSQAITPLRMWPWEMRLGNAAASVASYLENAVLPHDLSVFYRLRDLGTIVPQVILGVALLAGLTGLSLRLARRTPYLATGWFWFAGMLVPVIGIVQLGAQAMADRYMYLPLAGLLIVAVWGVADLAARRRIPRAAQGLLAAGLLVPLLAAARHQTGFWRDDFTLFSHAVEVDPGNGIARNNLGYDLLERQRYPEAADQFSRAVQQYPGYYEALNNLGIALNNLGRSQEAVQILRRAIGINPQAPLAYMNLGLAYVFLGERGAALEVCRTLGKIDPEKAAQIMTYVNTLPE